MRPASFIKNQAGRPACFTYLFTVVSTIPIVFMTLPSQVSELPAYGTGFLEKGPFCDFLLDLSPRGFDSLEISKVGSMA